MAKTEILEHIEPAVETWTRSLRRHQNQKANVNNIDMDVYTSVAVNTAAYLRVFLLVDVDTAMGLFLKFDFGEMRNCLRGGELVEAAERGVGGLGLGLLGHLASGGKCRVSMGAVPCGEI